MLILTRRIGEAIMIGDSIEVRVLELKGNQVRIGIEAPKHVAVHRQEVAERMAMEEGAGKLVPITPLKR